MGGRSDSAFSEAQEGMEMKRRVCKCSQCQTDFLRAENDGSSQRDRCFYCRNYESDQHKKPLQAWAHRILRDAISRGLIPKLGYTMRTEIKCVDCGGMAQGWDHRDYTKPLDVMPVCRPCNNRRGPAYPYNIEEATK